MDNQVQQVNLKKNDEHHQFPTTKDILKLSLNKFHSVESRNITSKIREAEKRISSLNRAQSRVADKLQERMLDRDFANMWKSNKCRCRSRAVIYEKKRELGHLLEKMEESKSTCKILKISNNEPDNYLVKSLSYQIKHGKLNLAGERKVLNEIKEAATETEKIIADYTTKPFGWCLKPDEGVMQNRLKIISSDLVWLNMENNASKFNLTSAKEAIDSNTAECQVAKLQQEWEYINTSKDELCIYILQLKSQSDETG